MRVAFFEDAGAVQLGPLALTRPVFELVCGRFSLRERVLSLWPQAEWGVFIRNYLTEVYREEHPGAAVNDGNWLAAGPVLLLNGRWLPEADRLAEIGEGDVGLIGETIAYLALQPSSLPLFASLPWHEALEQAARASRPVPAGGVLIEYPWHLVERNGPQLEADFRVGGVPSAPLDLGHDVALLGRPEAIHIDASAIVDPFTVIDARRGPVFIDREAVIQPFTRLEGPCYVGPGAQLFRAHVRAGTTIGPHCRLGGEIEASILHGYVNSYHDGFLGHAYVGPWVNLGALTTNSDLRNDYSPVRVPIGGEMVDTGAQKVGCFIGDHAKTALASLFNTGSSVGVMSMILPAGELLPKQIPSFCRVWHGQLDDGLDLEGALETARTVMRRRGCQLSDAQERLLRYLHAATKAEREAAILRFREKQDRRRTPSAIYQAS